MKPNKGKLDYRGSYWRRLPHFQPVDAVLFITFRLAGSLPLSYVQELRRRAKGERLRIAESETDEVRHLKLDEQRRREFGRWDDALDRVLAGPVWLKEPAVADVVFEGLLHFDGQRYDLDACCVMPNHVHMLIRPLEKEDGETYSLASLMHSIKGYTAHGANRVLCRRGRFWQPESYDRVVRDEGEWERVVRYILNNPVKAGLVEDEDDWAWSYYEGRR